MMLCLTGRAPNPDTSMVVLDELIDIGIPVIKWYDDGGFDGYTTAMMKHVVHDTKTGMDRTVTVKGQRYASRKRYLPAVAGRNPLDSITQLIVHHSGADRADPSIMFDVLYNQRGLSVHFAIEDDGRIWQFNNVADCCWHAGANNPISVGAECCLFPFVKDNPHYYDDPNISRLRNLPHAQTIEVIHGQTMRTYRMPEPQWRNLARLYAGIWVAVGLLRSEGPCDAFSLPPLFPRDAQMQISRAVLPHPLDHIGLLGHLHCTSRKVDPCGFPWDVFEDEVSDRWYDFHNIVIQNKEKK